MTVNLTDREPDHAQTDGEQKQGDKRAGDEHPNTDSNHRDAIQRWQDDTSAECLMGRLGGRLLPGREPVLTDKVDVDGHVPRPDDVPDGLQAISHCLRLPAVGPSRRDGLSERQQHEPTRSREHEHSALSASLPQPETLDGVP